jgi:quercetin dioxygenase-like cupin family protein
MKKLIAVALTYGAGLWTFSIHRPLEKKNMKNFVLLLIVLLSCACPLVLSQEEAQGVMKSSDANFTLLNIGQLAEQNPIDPQIGLLMTNAASGENASVNLTQIAPGAHGGAHYHQGLDEIDYVIQGQANMTVDGRNYTVQAGDLIYLPPLVDHDFTALGNETFRILVVFAPPFNGKDRVYV